MRSNRNCQCDACKPYFERNAALLKAAQQVTIDVWKRKEQWKFKLVSQDLEQSPAINQTINEESLASDDAHDLVCKYR